VRKDLASRNRTSDQLITLRYSLQSTALPSELSRDCHEAIELAITNHMGQQRVAKALATIRTSATREAELLGCIMRVNGERVSSLGKPKEAPSPGLEPGSRG
jgi:hypothetical protein